MTTTNHEEARKRAVHDANNAMLSLNNRQYIEPEDVPHLLKCVPTTVLEVFLGLHGAKENVLRQREALEASIIRNIEMRCPSAQKRNDTYQSSLDCLRTLTETWLFVHHQNPRKVADNG